MYLSQNPDFQGNNPKIHINIAGKPLPFPFDLSDKPLQDYIGNYEKIGLELGIKKTFNAFKELLLQGKISANNLE